MKLSDALISQALVEDGIRGASVRGRLHSTHCFGFASEISKAKLCAAIYHLSVTEMASAINVRSNNFPDVLVCSFVKRSEIGHTIIHANWRVH